MSSKRYVARFWGAALLGTTADFRHHLCHHLGPVFFVVVCQRRLAQGQPTHTLGHLALPLREQVPVAMPPIGRLG